MADLLEKLLGVTIAVFMAGSLLEMGLKLDLKRAGHALRDVRFMATAVLWSFAIGPALAILLARGMPLAEPYALGLILLGLAPCAPFVPLLAEKAGADLNYIAAYLLLAAVGTLIMLPIMIPILAPQLSADSWTIAKPLLFFIALPLAVGICVRLVASALADKSHPIVKKVTSVDIILMLGIVLLLYWRDFLSAVGSYAIAAQILYYCLLGAAAYGLGFGLSHAKRSALVLGLCTRNVGAAIAPLLSVSSSDQRATVMCVMAVFITLAVGFGAAYLLGRRNPASEPAHGGA
ncbi:MAG: bile acid:sodium symporter [Bradyrhizobium sp.]|jgi:bile acid:Na+ symporter, BASS family|uniref:bile acid:sodium symporter family protein n=1 Tax=Bradyrhizobium sp. TaxID=376 RepID=UPI003C7DC92B